MMKQSATITLRSVCLQTICVQCIHFNILLKGGGGRSEQHFGTIPACMCVCAHRNTFRAPV